VGAGKAMGLTVLPSPAPSTLSLEDLDLMVDQLGVTPTANTVVALLIPPTTMVTDLPEAVGGFHSVSPAGLPFFVVFESATAPAGFRSPLDIITIGASHELAEAATDPFPPPLGGAWIDDQLDIYGEVADLCVPLWNLMPVGKSGAAAPSGDYGTSKFYSNAAAKAGAAITCLPNFVHGQPGLNVQVAPESVSLAPGESATLTLTFVSDGDPGAIDWDLDTPLAAGVSASAMMGKSTLDGVVSVTLTANTSFEDFPLAVFVQSETDQYSHGVYWILVKSR
jgi:hypothetical protein